MLSLLSLRERAIRPELMDDDLAADGKELREAFRQLRRLNRLFGAAGPTLFGVKRLWTLMGRPRELSILDVGAGSGDINRVLLRWADRHHIRLRIVLCDISEEACLEAENLYRDEPRVHVMKRDVFQLPGRSADIVTATQFVHHFPSERLPEIVQHLVHTSRIGVAINDIHRHWLAWFAVYVTVHLISRNKFIRHDGPLSVAKGFRASDWKKLKGTIDVTHFTYRWRPLFRYTVVIHC